MTETFQITAEQAESYEEMFVPAVFAEWAPPLCDIVDVQAGDRVLDVACGTGVVAREAATRAGATGHVVGLDLNPAMLEVARRRAPDLDWREGDAGALPIADGEFDAVVCSSALFFFPDVAAALAEMARVVRPGGRVGLVTFAGLERQPGYGPFVDTVVRHAGGDAAHLLSTYWSQGDAAALSRKMAGVGLTVVETRDRVGTAHFPSVDAVAQVEIKGSPLAERIDEPTYQEILRSLRAVMAPYASSDGRLDLPIRGLVIGARRD